MKSLIVYYSNYKHNTEKIAELFAKELNADLINLKDSRDIKIDDYDLIGFGSGVYKESVAPQLLNCIENLSLKDKKVFAFSTSGVGIAFYNKKLIDLLVQKGAECKGGFACKGSFSSKDFGDNKIFEIMSKFAKGHPNDRDFRKAGKFITKVALKMW